MKAIRIQEAGGPEVLRLEDIPDPTPAADQIVVEVEKVGLNFIEVYQRKGIYPMKLPYTPGREGAGTVVAVGSDVKTLKVGDRIATEKLNGSYAEFATAKENEVVKLPDGVDTATGAAAMLQGMTVHYLATSIFPLKKGDRCLVHAAAGGVGLILCQVAKHRGAWVIGTTSTPEKAKLAREAGADEVILYTQQDFVAEVKRLTNGAGVDVVYDSVGKTTFDGSIDCLRKRGWMVLFGQSSGVVPPFDPLILNRKGSLFLTRPKLDDYLLTSEELAQRAGELLSWIEEGWLELHIDRTYALADAADAHRALESRETVGKLLLAP